MLREVGYWSHTVSCQCREVYDAASPNYRGRCTAPLLVDKRSRRLACNESSDIVRMLNSVLLPGTFDVDLYPSELAAEIDSVNEIVHNNVRNPFLPPREIEKRKSLCSLLRQPVCNIQYQKTADVHFAAGVLAQRFIVCNVSPTL